MSRVVVIGAGVGGLSAAAALSRLGFPVTVLEAQVYPGGCASTFYHQGYRFDTGATLAAGFYPGGPMDKLAQAAGIADWPFKPAEEAMLVHLPGVFEFTLTAGEDRWEKRQAAFGEPALPFFRWQEDTADALWQLALQQPAWPPQTAAQAAELAHTGLAWLATQSWRHQPRLLVDAFRPVAAHLPAAANGSLRRFVDAQLLISAQATSRQVNALYGAAALDLARRGVVHLEGGMGAIADALVKAVRRNGGQVLFRQEAIRIHFQSRRPLSVETRDGSIFEADIVIANLSPWNIRPLLMGSLPPRLKRLGGLPGDTWGAFVVYAGVDANAIPAGKPLHHQIVAAEPLGEGNSVYLSISPEWDASRAPVGQRAVTLSTHTRLTPWWELQGASRTAYEHKKQQLAERLLKVAETAIPNLREAASLILPGTPVTFQRFTRRYLGWVGGFPQTSLLRSWGPRLGTGLWMVGDSIFPGQSTAAVALGGLRVARAVAEGYGIELETGERSESDEDRGNWKWIGRGDVSIRHGDARVGREFVLVDLNQERAQAKADDSVSIPSQRDRESILIMNINTRLEC